MIPKKVHLSWKTKDLLDSESPLITEGVKKLIELNPNWEVTIYDDAEVDAYLQDKLEPQLYALIADKHIVQKTDLWRLIKLYIEGGLYMDIDRFVNTPLDDLVDEGTKWVVPTCRDYDFSHDFMMTARKIRCIAQPYSSIYNGYRKGITASISLAHRRTCTRLLWC
jgi:mannosyltransferase OCH1-like enzyme